MAAINDSPAWYRVADVKPRLQDHITIHRHEYRHHAWFILLDRHKGRSHRFNASAYFVISCMNGQRTLQEIHDIVNTKFVDDAPSQDEIIALLGKLYLAGLIQTDKVVDIDELSRRTEHSRRQRIQQYFLNPLALRLPLLNPDRFLDYAIRFVKPVFKRRVFHIWLVMIVLALLLAFINWPELSSATRLFAFSTHNMLLFFLIYPAVKLLHELGHALAIRHYGGEVNEMGIMLMIFVPIPYVNAYSATAFSDKRQRMLVSAMGIMVETTLAAIALFIWLNIEPGVLRNICLDVMLIGGVSTLLVNGNPLMKYDGYHVLADAIETPNLATRAKKYLSFKIHQWLFRIEKADSGITDDSERLWFFGYALATFVYRIFIMLFILGMVLDRFFAAGVMLATWMIAVQIILPGLRYVKQLSGSAQMPQHRQRVYGVFATLGLVLLLTLFIVPVPQTSSTQGIIWLAEEMQIKANSPGFIRSLHVENNHRVMQGEVLVDIEDPLLTGRIKVLEAKLRELQVKHTAKRRQHLEAEQLKQDMTNAEAELDLQKQRLSALTIRSPASGNLIIPDYRDLPGQFVQQGQILGFILEPNHLVARIIISEQEIALFSQENSAFEIRPISQPDKIITARFKRLLPEAIRQLPSAALGIRGGGPTLVDPADPAGRKTIDKVFQLELSLPADEVAGFIGSRVYVRIRHGRQPLARQWGRSLKQLLLGRFNA